MVVNNVLAFKKLSKWKAIFKRAKELEKQGLSKEEALAIAKKEALEKYIKQHCL